MNKKFTTLLGACCFLLFSVAMNAQTPRMVLLEEGTQASCPPCATQNPPFDALIEANEEKVAAIKYQTSWPGFDQMNLDNPSEVADRVSYYGFSGVPNALMNGVDLTNDCGAYEGAPSCLEQSEIDAAHDEISEFEMMVSGEVVDGILTVTGSVTATMVAEGDFKLRIALTEKLITIAQAPGGTNGETEYIHVMKKFVGGTAGYDLADTWAINDSYTFTETLDLGPLTVYNYDKFEVVAFVQDDNTKLAHQAAKDSEIPITVQYGTNVSAVESVGLPAGVCSGPNSFSPSVVIQNGGNDALTSVDIVYSINGGAPQTSTWTGDLATLGKATVALDPYEFVAAVGVDNDLSISMENPNGVADENADDNTTNAIISPAGTSTDSVKVVIQPDNYGAETTWVLSDDTGATLASGGPYTNGNTDLVEVVVMVPTTATCLKFDIADTYGDGICCGFGQGYYQVVDENTGLVIIEGGEFTTDDSQPFEQMMVVSNEELTNESAFEVFPNPTTGLFNVALSNDISNDASLEIFDVLGQRVAVKGAADMNNSIIEIDLTKAQSGVYFVRVVAGENIYTQSVTVQQ